MIYNDQKLQDLMRKIRALKAKADDPSTTEAESLVFAAKVAELLAAHGLEEAQLEVTDQPGIGHEDYAANWNTSPARRVLAIAICQLYFVKPLIRKNKGAPWTLIGRKHNIVMVKEMADYLIKTTIRLSNDYGRSYPGANVIDFRRGCFKRLAERLIELRHQQTQEKAQFNERGNPGNLPALYQSEETLASAYMMQHWPRTGYLKMQRIKQGYDALAGRAAGDRISLSQQVGAASKANLLGRRR